MGQPKRNPVRGKNWFAVWMTVLMLGMAAPSQAAVLGIGVTGKAGTTGLGADLTVPLISNWVNLRGGYNNLSFFSTSVTFDGIKYSGDMEFQDAPLFLDVHPFGGSFRVSGGVYWLDHDAILTATPTSNIDVGGQTFTPSEVGSLRSDIQHGRDWGPYLGIGWGNAADDNFMDLPIAVGLSLDLGLIYVGESSVSMRQVGGTTNISQSSLDQEARDIEDKLNDYEFFPVATIGLHIRF